MIAHISPVLRIATCSQAKVTNESYDITESVITAFTSPTTNGKVV
jgi:hypothetical protein